MTMTTISLDPQAIEQLSGERKTLIDAIDSLRKHGIAHRVDIPQIIVVGEPSSGKSSVLEAISRVHFPVKDRLCTRIATELVLRTDPQVKLRVRVRPSSFSSHLAHTFDETSFDKDDLPRIVEEAETHLLRGALGFSEDVLRIEICAPHLPHLTLIDLPGFIHTGSDGGKQSATDREIVDLLLARYMAKKDNVILAVVSADNQASLQRVLSKVQRHDKKYERTFGIITKLDLLDQGSEDEDSLLKLVRNQDSSYRLALGWHILRNRSATEASLSSADRDVKELEFFDSSVWSAIPANTRGATTLRKKLANILFDHTRSGLNTVIKDLDGNLKTRQKALAQLGEPKSSPRQLREYLGKIASQFQLLSLHAIEGNYSHEFFGGLYPDSSASAVDDNRIKKLRALVRDLNRTFAYILATKGSRRIICDNTLDGAGKNPKLDLPPFLRVLHDQYTFENPETVTRNAIREELEPLSSANQGTELPGGANDLLVVKLFRDQSAPWEDIARFHIDLVLRIVKAFTEKLVAHITGSDEKTRSAILLNIVDPFFEKRAIELENKLQELLYNYRRGYAQPLDADFRSIMDKHRQDALATETLRKLLADRPGLFTENGKRELSSLSTNGRKSDFGVDSVIDKSETYYELSLRTFTDNVVILAVENCLINDLPTIFTTGRVCQMKDDELTVLAAESADLQAERSLLQRECQALKEVLDLCKTYRVRNLTVLTTSQPSEDDFKRKDSSTSSSSNVVYTPSATSVSQPASLPTKAQSTGQSLLPARPHPVNPPSSFPERYAALSFEPMPSNTTTDNTANPAVKPVPKSSPSPFAAIPRVLPVKDPFSQPVHSTAPSTYRSVFGPFKKAPSPTPGTIPAPASMFGAGPNNPPAAAANPANANIAPGRVDFFKANITTTTTTSTTPPPVRSNPSFFLTSTDSAGRGKPTATTTTTTTTNAGDGPGGFGAGAIMR